MAAHEYKIEEIPEGASVRPDPVVYHREGDELLFVSPGRRVIDIPGHTWPAARPEECQNNGSIKAKWFANLVLLCQGCGLDCT